MVRRTLSIDHKKYSFTPMQNDKNQLIQIDDGGRGGRKANWAQEKAQQLKKKAF